MRAGMGAAQSVHNEGPLYASSAYMSMRAPPRPRTGVALPRGAAGTAAAAAAAAAAAMPVVPMIESAIGAEEIDAVQLGGAT